MFAAPARRGSSPGHEFVRMRMRLLPQIDLLDTLMVCAQIRGLADLDNAAVLHRNRTILDEPEFL